MMKTNEYSLYPVIKGWFNNYLKSKFRKTEIEVFDTHRRTLSKFLQENNFKNNFPLCDTFEIKVDLTAIIKQKNAINLAFIEVKSGQVRLRDIGQLLGYCKVADPLLAFLISPNWISVPVHHLLINYGKQNILEYNNKKIVIAEWNEVTNSINFNRIIPRG